MTLDQTAELLVRVWEYFGVAFLIFSLGSIPILSIFFGVRFAQLRDPNFEMRAVTPTYSAIQHCCTIVYGLLFPAFYFLSVRRQHSLLMWNLGPDTNTTWTILIGAICVTWMGVHSWEGLMRWGAPRFTRGLVDRIFGVVAFSLCLWFHFKTLGYIFVPNTTFLSDIAIQKWIVGIIYPQTVFAGATLVYGFALAESFRKVQPTVRGTARWKLATTLSLLGSAIVFAPFWLSVPRVSHESAMALLDEHHDSIVEIAELAEIDPALLAGVVYVAQTRDHPRFTGKYLEELGLRVRAIDMESGFSAAMSVEPMINPSAGPAQMRISTAEQTLAFAHDEENVGAGYMMDNMSQATAMWLAKYGPKKYAERYSDLSEYSSRELLRRIPRILEDGFGTFANRGVMVIPFQNVEALDPYINALILDDEANLVLAAIMLAAFDYQWREAGFPIDDRPEILATLYNIGYERSNPHGAPRANDFGRRVKAFMESDAGKEMFTARGEDRRRD